jgi:ABC-type glycerol-3-phosphate transport system permease component
MMLLLQITAFASMLCACLSLSLAAYFFSHRARRLGRALMWMLIGEAVGMAVVTVFALMEMRGLITDLDPAVATSIRWVAISATAATSLHLTHQVGKVIHHYDEGPEG